MAKKAKKAVKKSKLGRPAAKKTARKTKKL